MIRNHVDKEGTVERKSFLLSNIPSKTERDHLIKKIRDLGGFHVDSKHFDKSASHIICGKLSRTEKFLGACVTGKWILSPRYIEDSHQVQMWLDEEDYEFSVTDTSQPEGLASAAKRWKWKNNMDGSLPFTDWRVSLYMNSKKKAGFHIILRSGGAQIVPLERTQALQDVAFVLVDAEKFNDVPKLQEDFDILCIREDYLGDYLIKDPEPDIFDYLIDKNGNRQNVATIIPSPQTEPKKASKSKTEKSGIRNEKFLSDNGIGTRGKDFGGMELTADGNPGLNELESDVVTNYTSDKKFRKGKRPLAVRSSDPVFPQQLGGNSLPGSDEFNPPIKKARKAHSDNHMSQFSPKNLRSLQKMKESSSKNKSPGLRIYEDDHSGENDGQMSSDGEMSALTFNKNPKDVKVNGKTVGQNMLCLKADPPASACSTPASCNNNFTETAASKIVSRDVSIEETSSECSVAESQAKLSNPPTSISSSVLTQDVQDPPQPSEKKLQGPSNTSDQTSLCMSSRMMSSELLEEKHSEDSSKSINKKSEVKTFTKEQEDKKPKISSDELTKSFKKTPVQMSLQRFGFQSSKTPIKSLKTGASSPKLKKETSSPSSTPPRVGNQLGTPGKVKSATNVSNTPETAIVIDDCHEYNELSKLCSSITCDLPDPERIRHTHEQALASNDAISADGESLYDLMKEVMSLCNDISDDMPATIDLQQSKSVVSESVTYQEVCCNDSMMPHIPYNSRHETESVIGTKNNPAVKDVENEAMNTAENVSALCKNNEVSVSGQEKMFQDSCNTSVNNHPPSDMNLSELRENKDLEMNSSRAEIKIPLSSVNAVSYYLDSASDKLFPMSVPCVDSERKAFTSQLIPQWMHVSSEMKFFTVSLEHGRPDVNQKPTKELLSELINLLTGEVTPRTRNLAFHYLMSWFEENPPTNPLSIKMYCDLFGFTTNKTLMPDLLDVLIWSPTSEGHLLNLDFIVAVCEVNFWHHVNSGKRNSIKECLLIKWLWSNSFPKIHFNTNLSHVLEVFKSVLGQNSPSSQSVKSITTLIGLIFECLRLVGNYWNIENFSCLTDCMISLSVNIAKRIKEAFVDGDKQVVIALLQHFKNPWLRTLVTASILSNLNDFLVMETIQISSISLKSIVTQYFFLLPPLTKRPDSKAGLNSKVVLEKVPISRNETNNRLRNDIKSCRSLKVNKRNGKGESKVHEAAIRNNAEQLKQLLTVPGVDVNMKDNCGWTPLHEACNHGSYECVELLLNFVPKVNSIFDDQDDSQRRVNISAKGFVSKTPLHDAVVNNRVAICKLLLKYGGKKLLEAKTDDGYTPMDLAKTDEMKEVLLMHENGASCSISSSIQTDNHLPLSCMYDKVLKSEHGCFHVTRKDSTWFLSLLGLLMSSYMNYALLKGGNSFNDKDLTIVNSLDHHCSLLQEHLKNITSSETYRNLQFQLHLVKTVVNEYMM